MIKKHATIFVGGEHTAPHPPFEDAIIYKAPGNYVYIYIHIDIRHSYSIPYIPIIIIIIQNKNKN